jgi:hypothetical protein
MRLDDVEAHACLDPTSYERKQNLDVVLCDVVHFDPFFVKGEKYLLFDYFI